LKGRDLTKSLRRKLAPSEAKTPLSQGRLADALGMSTVALWSWDKQKKDITAKQISNLVEKAMAQARKSAEQGAINPIVEFYPIAPADSKQQKSKELFPPSSTLRYQKELRVELQSKHGIYIFYDSRGRALYAGKALSRSLWDELKSVFNKQRDVQNVWRVRHPTTDHAFKTSEEIQRKIVRENLALHSLAKYVSVYSVPRRLYQHPGRLLIRGFANDLLNERMENFSKPRAKKRKKRSK
jgi:hypothetical protein